MPPTELYEQRVDGSDLHPMAATRVADLCRFDVILRVWPEEGEGRESLYELGASLRPRKALQQFLQNESRCEDLLRTEQRVTAAFLVGSPLTRNARSSSS